MPKATRSKWLTQVVDGIARLGHLGNRCIDIHRHGGPSNSYEGDLLLGLVLGQPFYCVDAVVAAYTHTGFRCSKVRFGRAADKAASRIAIVYIAIYCLFLKAYCRFN